MPLEFVVVAVAFFDTKWSQSACGKFFLFEPICTALLLAAASAVHVIRIHAIYDMNRFILFGMSALFAVQVVVTAICCGFYRSVPLLEGQGCIAGPKQNWVGIYWVAPTLLYTLSFGLAVMRSVESLQTRPLSPWKLMLRDGLNLYGAIWIVNMVNMFFWFIMSPTDDRDPVKTIVTSMAAVLTCSMTLRIILSVRGSLDLGGSFALSASTGNSSRSTQIISARSGNPVNGSIQPNTFTLDDLRTKPESEWAVGPHDKSSISIADRKNNLIPDSREPSETSTMGVKVTIDRDTK
jgi:hypothetical protein